MTEFISRNYGKEGYEIIIKTDSHEHYRATEDFARRLIDHAKPMRNADKIRAMSDEELTNLLTDFSNNGGWVTEIGREVCYKRITDWLHQPAEEENNELR